MTKDMPVETATQYCSEMLRRHDRDRYLTTLFAPPAARPRLIALYAFNLEIARVREAVSEPMMGEIRLQWWREAVAETEAGQPRRHRVAEALAEAVGEGGLSGTTLLALIDARARDLDDTRFARLDDLVAYAEATSSMLLAAALDLLGVADGGVRRAARAVGIAYALTGLMRAVPFHTGQRRLFLPLDLLERHGVSPQGLFDRPAPERLSPVLAELADTAASHLNEAKAAAPRPPAAAVPVLLHATLARRQLARLRRHGFNPYEIPLEGGQGGDALALALKAWRRRF
ncbi:MAG TPA: phytoene/squalene synthase family protein [Alphaproteobacteria bacterium]|nr:phytoene/squalene synthase family protein [Alphaproteobacteria bacterium]